MLAWLHQATASEKEHLEAMLKLVTIQGSIYYILKRKLRSDRK